ncbi:MAG: sigma 54-interacting transcriptional regulator [Planctomycetota bacterium]
MPPPPVINARYQVLSELGGGATSRVYRVRDLTHGTELALKKFSPLIAPEIAAAEFGRQIGAAFPGVCRVEDCGLDFDDGAFFFCAELVEGVDLAAAGRSSSAGELVHLVAHALRALAFVHERGLIHRDIKPANILVDHRIPRRRWGETCPLTLLDFGLATGPGQGNDAAGTPLYMAPEVFRGAPPDARADLFSLGAVLYEILTGRSFGEGWPEPGRTPRVDPRKMLESIDGAVSRLSWHLLATDPAERPSTAQEGLVELIRLAPFTLRLDTPETRAGRALSLGDPGQGLAEAAGWLLQGLAGRALLIEWCLEREASVMEAHLGRYVAAAGRLPLTFVLEDTSTAGDEALGVMHRSLAQLLGREDRGERSEELAHASITPGRLARTLREVTARRPVVVFLEGIPSPDHKRVHEFVEVLCEARVPLVLIPREPRDAERLAEQLSKGVEVRRVTGQRVPGTEVRGWLRRWLGAEPSTELEQYLGDDREQSLALLQASVAAELRAGSIRVGEHGASLARVSGLERRGERESQAQAVEAFHQRLLPCSSARDTRLLRCLALARSPVLEGGIARLADDERTAASASELVRLGLVRVTRRGGDRLYALSSGTLRRIIERETPPGVARDLHAGLADWARASGAPVAEIAWHLSRSGQWAEALPLLLSSAREHLRRFHLDRACELLHEAERAAKALGDDPSLGEALRLLGESSLLAGDVPCALAYLERALERARGGEMRAAILVDLGRAHEKLGAYDLSQARLEEALKVPEIAVSDRDQARVGQALILYRKGSYDQAASVCREVLAAQPEEASHMRLRASNLLGLIAEERGQYEAAAAHLGSVVTDAELLGSPSMQASALMNAARCDRARGLVRAAIAKLRRAEELFAEEGEKHYLTIIHCNSVCYYLLLGEAAEAKRRLQQADECLQERPDESLRALHDYYLGMLAFAEGELGAAESSFQSSLQVRERLGERYACVETLIEWSRATLRRGDLERCGALLARAEPPVEELASRTLRGNWLAARLEAALLGGVHPEVGRLCEELRQLASDLEPLRKGFTLAALARARWVLGDLAAMGDAAREGGEVVAGSDVAALRSMLEVLALVARRTWPMPLEPVEEALRAIPAGVYGEEHAWLLLALAREGLRHIERLEEPPGGVGAAARTELRTLHGWADRAVRLYARLGHALGRAEAEAVRAEAAAWIQRLGGGEAAAQRLHALERMRHLSKAINNETDDEKLLRMIIDTGVELASARRGFLILVRGDRLDIRVARNLGDEDIHNPQFEISHTVAGRVARTGEPLLISNAMGDPDWGTASSVSHLRLLSILCVPLRVKGRTIGSLYVDDPTAVDRFGPWHLEMLSDFSDHAAIALQKSLLLRENVERARELAASKREIERLAARLRRTVDDQARELVEMKATLDRTRKQLALKYDYSSIVTHSPKMRLLLAQLDRITDSSFPVLIQGESGTGKELVARMLHFNGPRRAKALQALNCAAFPEALVEAELFGYRRGAFTGADGDRAGVFEVADGGTLFLDEIGDMSTEVQKKLLRVLQSGEFYRLGDREARRVDVRVIAATHRDLHDLVANGLFREDLFFRLNVLRIVIPPLRERPEDVPLLFEHFQRQIAEQLGRPPLSVTREAMDALTAYEWPGNVRELENETRNLLCFAGERARVELGDLPDRFRRSTPPEESVGALSLREQVEQLERRTIAQALRATRGNKAAAARLLGMTPRNLFKKLQRLGLSPRGGAAASEPRGGAATK